MAVIGWMAMASVQAAVIGEYTFNDTGSGTTAVRMAAAMGSVNTAAGATLSQLGTNTTTQLDFGGFNNTTATDNDGFSFGSNGGNSLLWFYRAESGQPSAWGSTVGTGKATAPLNFTVTADAAHDVTIKSVSIDQKTSTDFIYYLQEAGTTRGTGHTIADAGIEDVALDSPVTVAAGTSKTFTLLLNSGGYNQVDWFNGIVVNGTITAGSASLLGEYTFNDLGSGSDAERFAAALAVTNAAAGAMLSPLGTNTATQLDFAGFNNVPATVNDGIGFGGSEGNTVAFWHRAEGGQPSAWGIKDDTSATVQPLNFTVTAGVSNIVTIHSVEFDTGGNGTPTIYTLQEAGTARGPEVNYGMGGIVYLDTPVIAALGASKTFTVYMNSGNFNSSHQLNNIKVYGTSTVEEIFPAAILEFSLDSGTVMKLVLDAPSSLGNYHPESISNLVSGSWGTVPHSDDGIHSFETTNLNYSTSEGTNTVIYVQADAASKFFRVQGE